MSDLHKRISRLRRRIAAAQLKLSKNKKQASNLFTESEINETQKTVNIYKKQLAVLEEEFKKSKK